MRGASDKSGGFDASSFLKQLTNRPGVYRMIGPKAKIIYVGKARNLKKRVSSYFHKQHADAKTAAMIAQVVDVEVTVTNTEAEALLLEYNLIKRHRPRFNVTLRDDKSYPWVYVATEHPFPRLQFYRGARRKKGRYFGPYPNAGAVRRTLNELQKLFLLRNCRDSYFRNRSRPCLQHQIKRCTAPCVGLIAEADYAADVDAAVLFLEGKNRDVIDAMVGRMERAAGRQEYEQAARFRDMIAKLKRIEAEQLVSRHAGRDIDVVGIASDGRLHCATLLFIRNGTVQGSRHHFPSIAASADVPTLLSGFLSQYYLGRDAPGEIIVPADFDDRELLARSLAEKVGRGVRIRFRVRGDRSRWLALATQNAEQGLRIRAASNATIKRQFRELGAALDLDAPPERLECFDVSHTSGEAAVASCVVFNQAGPLKSDYRRFNVKPDAAGDDYAALREALERRYARIQKGEVPVPDVLFIDGGRGQLGKAREVLAELDLDWIQVVGVAKGTTRKPGMEQLFLAGKSTPLILPPDSPALHLIQQIRDEAHRFAITGHRQRRSKARRTSRLEEIPGLGPKRRRELLRQFGGLKGVSEAGIDDLAKVHGISRSLAERIYNDLHADGA